MFSFWCHNWSCILCASLAAVQCGSCLWWPPAEIATKPRFWRISTITAYGWSSLIASWRDAFGFMVKMYRVHDSCCYVVSSKVAAGGGYAVIYCPCDQRTQFFNYPQCVLIVRVIFEMSLLALQVWKVRRLYVQSTAHQAIHSELCTADIFKGVSANIQLH
jgi:hypothetical protein